MISIAMPAFIPKTNIRESPEQYLKKYRDSHFEQIYGEEHTFLK